MSNINVYHRRMTQPQLRAALAADLSPLQLSAVEILAGLTSVPNPAYLPFDMRRYGWTIGGVVDNSAALAMGISVAAVGGGELLFPQGVGVFSAFPSLDGLFGVIFRGVGANNSGATRGTTLAFTGTGAGVMISALGSAAIQFRELQLRHTSTSFTGTYFKPGNNGSFNGIFDCFIGSTLSNCTHVDLDKSVNFTAERTLFTGGAPSIKGMAAASFSNVHRFWGCEWNNSPSVPITGGGQAWGFFGCTFEALTNGKAACFDSGAVAYAGLTFKNCWFDDVTVAGGTWFNVAGQNLDIDTCVFGGEVTNTTVVTTNSGAKGVKIENCNIALFSAIVNFASTPAAVSIRNNVLISVTAPFTTPANAPIDLVYAPNSPAIAPPATLGKLAANGFLYDDHGVLEQWGTAAVTVGTPLAVLFATNGINFPTACWNVSVSLVGATANTDTVNASATPTTTGFTINVAGTAGTSTVHWRAKGN